MDKNLKKICKEVANEYGLEPETVEYQLKFLSDWTREKLINMEAAAILWNKLGTFKVITNRAGEHKHIVKEFKNKFKKNESEEKCDQEEDDRSGDNNPEGYEA